MQYQHSSVGGHHSTYKFISLKRGHNSKTTAFRVMRLVLQLHRVMMSKYSKFGIDTLSTFRVMGFIKFKFCHKTCIKTNLKDAPSRSAQEYCNKSKCCWCGMNKKRNKKRVESFEYHLSQL